MKKIVLVEMLDETFETFSASCELIPDAEILYSGPQQRGRVEQHGTGAVVPLYFLYLFDAENSPHFCKPPMDEYNEMFLRMQQTWANDMLRSRGHLFLNEVLGMIGVAHTKEGSLVGWVLGDGPTFIDFNPRVIDEHGSIQLNFNVYGPIVHLLK